MSTNSRDLVILFTEDYLRSPYTRSQNQGAKSLPDELFGAGQKQDRGRQRSLVRQGR
jgi:hypothetical protein